MLKINASMVYRQVIAPQPRCSIEVTAPATKSAKAEPRLKGLRHGETIEFIGYNDGVIRQEISIGNSEGQLKHAESMRSCRI